MRLQEITDIYKELGLGTQTERDEFLKWSFDESKQTQEMTFIIETTKSDLNLETENAQLA